MLTDTQCRGAKATGKPYKLRDGKGLYLHVSATGHRSWRLKYRFDGKEKLRTLGSFPAVGLKEARDRRDAERQLLSDGKDPAAEAKRVVLAKRVARADTFEALAREWHGKQVSRWKEVHAKDVIESLERDVFPALGRLPVTEITNTLVLAALRAVEDRGAVETAHRLRQRISSIFAYGIAEGRASSDPAALLVKVLASKPSSKRRPAVTTMKKVREVLALSDTAEATPVVKLASRFLALTAQRPGMVRWLRWDELHGFDPRNEGADEEAIWIVPAGKMKQEIGMREDEAFDHPVPLTPATVAVLRQAWRFSAGSSWVFPSQRSDREPMSENALSYLYLREGLRGIHVPHGWRSSFSTIMNEWIVENENGGPRDPMIVDLMLAHIPTGISGSELRYMRAGFVPRRRKLATIWSEMLLEGACAAESLVQGRRRRRF